jgi:hypothetical protein
MQKDTHMLKASGLAVWGMWFGAWLFAESWYFPHGCENSLPWYTVALLGAAWFLVLIVVEWLLLVARHFSFPKSYYPSRRIGMAIERA